MLHILTLTWNGKSKLEKLAPTLIKSLNNIEYKWLVKDNGSNDNSIEYLNGLNNPNIVPIQWKDNLQNFAQGCNLLFKEASPKESDYILLLNNDIIFNDFSSIKNMMKIMDNDDSVGVVGAKLNYTDTRKLQHAGIEWDKNKDMLPWHYRLGEMEDANARKNREFAACTGAVLLVRAGLYDNVCRTNKSGLNGFDEQFIWCFDDVDLNLAIKYNMNKKVVYCGETNIFHEESATLKTTKTNRLFMQHNVNLFRKKWSNVIKEDHQLYVSNPNYNLYKSKK